MKWSLGLMVFIFGACGLLNIEPPLPSEGPAVVPNAGSEYSYRYTGLDSAGDSVVFNETTRIANFDGGFLASRTSDGVPGFSTSRLDTLILRSDGDLMSYCGCDVIYPITTHSTYTVTTTEPIEQGGMTFDQVVQNSFAYLGTDSVKTGGTSYYCSRIGRLMSISPAKPTPGVPSMSVAMTYWYSSKVGYFVKEMSQSSDVKRKNYTRVLTSYRLGK